MLTGEGVWKSIQRRKLKVNKSTLMRCSRYENWGRMHARLNSEPLEEVDCFKYLWSQVAADERCERNVVNRINEINKTCRTLKSLLSNTGLGINPKKHLH